MRTPRAKVSDVLAVWMERVLDAASRAASAPRPEAVHEVRVALRRCRAIAGSLATIDPDPDWRRMRKQATALFRSLGQLRDTQVVSQWVERLAPGDELLLPVLRSRLDGREAELTRKSRKALDEFDRAEWMRLASRLSERCSGLFADGPLFDVLALERWRAAVELDRLARQRRSRTSWHRLRIGLKRFRYIVENFLPRKHALWEPDLKQLQDLLGEVHDLDLVWAEIVRMRVPAASRLAWRTRIDAERRARLRAYGSRTRGEQSLWAAWRRGLPEGQKLLAASTARLAAWAAFSASSAQALPPRRRSRR